MAMQHHHVFASYPILALLVAVSLRAQGGPPAPSAEQELLARMAGTWDCTTTFFKGEKPVGTSHLREDSERVCGGLFQLTRCHGIDLPMERCTLMGWDGRTGRICGVEADSMGPTPAAIDGTVDLKTGEIAWTLTTISEQGTASIEAEVRFDGDDIRIERRHAAMQDGTKALLFEVRSVRAKAKNAPAADAKPPAIPAIGRAPTAGTKLFANSKPYAHLSQFAGEWTVATKMEIPGAPAMQGAMASSEGLVCNGRWLLTRVDGEFASMPFHAVGLMGFDPHQNRYVSYWADSFGPYMAQSTGECDETGATFSMRGESIGLDGKSTTMEDTTTFAGKDARKTVMVSRGKLGKVDSTMTIECSRKREDATQK